MEQRETPTIRIELFSGPRVCLADGSVVTFQEKPGAVLALLALAPGNCRRRDDLAEAIWPEEDSEATRGRLRTTLSALRKAIPDGDNLIPLGGQTIRLNRGAGVEIDTLEFDRFLDQARETTDPRRQLELLSRAVDLYAGPLCPRIYVDNVILKRGLYEQKIEEARRCLRILIERAEAAQPIQPAVDTPVDDVFEQGSVESIPDSTRDPDAASGPCDRRQPRRITLAIALTAIIIMAVIGGGLWLRPRSSIQNAKAENRILLHDHIGSTTVQVERLDPEALTYRLQQLRKVGFQAQSPEEQAARRTEMADICTALSEGLRKASYGPDEARWLERLQPLDQDLNSSLQWLIDQNAQQALTVEGALARYWWRFERIPEARKWLEAALQRAAKKDTQAYARALAVYAGCLLDENSRQPKGAKNLSVDALRLIDESHAISVRINDRWGMAQSLRLRGHILHNLRRKIEAENSFTEALELFRDENNLAGEAYTLWGLSLIERPGESREDRILRHLDVGLRSVELNRKAQYDWGISNSFDQLSRSVDDLLTRKLNSKRPESLPLLKEFADQCHQQLDRPDVRNSSPEMQKIRAILTRAALATRDRATVVEQMWHLIGPHRQIPLDRAIKLSGAYVRHIHKCRHPPISARAVESQALTWVNPDPSGPTGRDLFAQGKLMSLEAAVKEATR